MERFKLKIKHFQTFFQLKEILLSKHVSFSTEDETFPSKNVFSTQKGSFLNEEHGTF